MLVPNIGWREMRVQNIQVQPYYTACVLHMPEINLIEVKSFTSQDAKHVAENLLTSKKLTGKWLIEKPRKCHQMEATFQLAQMCNINSVHIGNFGSAFVSLLVARSGSGSFETLLPCSELRSMQDSKLGRNKESVKMYFSDSFMEKTRNEKWDQLRVVVMQPFNQDEQFGLSFLSVYSFSENKTGDVLTAAELQKWDKLRNSSVLSKSPSMSRGSKLLQEARQKSAQCETKPTVKGYTEAIHDKNEDKETLFKVKVYSFMDSLNLRLSDLEHLRLKQLEQGFEKVLQNALNKQEKSWFISTVRNYLKNLLQTKEEANLFESDVVNCNVDMREESEANFSLGTKFLERQSQSPNTGKSRNHNLDSSATANTPDKNSLGKPSLDTAHKDTASNRRNLVSLEDSLFKSERLTEKASVSDVTVIDDDSKDYFPTTNNKPKQGQKRKLREEGRDAVEIDEAKCECVATFIECPICKDLFESSIIEAHSAKCNSFKDDEDDILEVPCPLCKKMVSAALLGTHADRCAYMMFGD